MTWEALFYRTTWPDHCLIWFFYHLCRYQTPPFHNGAIRLLWFPKQNSPHVCTAPTKATLAKKLFCSNVFDVFVYRNPDSPRSPIFARNSRIKILIKGFNLRYWWRLAAQYWKSFWHVAVLTGSLGHSNSESWFFIILNENWKHSQLFLLAERRNQNRPIQNKSRYPFKACVEHWDWKNNADFINCPQFLSPKIPKHFGDSWRRKSWITQESPSRCCWTSIVESNSCLRNFSFYLPTHRRDWPKYRPFSVQNRHIVQIIVLFQFLFAHFLEGSRRPAVFALDTKPAAYFVF